MKTAQKIKYMTTAALISAIYVSLTYLTNIFGMSSGVIQLRFSEALCILPVFTPAAIPGLFIGCLLSNFLTGCVILDVVFGSLATLVGAVGTYLLSKTKMHVYLYTLPAVISNTVVIPLVLKYAYNLGGSVWYFYITVGVGEILSCSVFGTLLYLALKKHQNVLFR